MTIKEEIKVFKTMTQEMATTFEKKRNDYGQTSSETWDKFGPVSLIVRMYDKLGRIENLLCKNIENLVDESVEDTLLDLANYALITILEYRKHKKE